MAAADESLGEPRYARMGDVAGQLHAPVVVVREDSTLLFANDAAASALGFAPDELVGRLMLEFVHPQDQLRVRRQLAAVASGRATDGFSRYQIRGGDDAAWLTFESTAHNFLEDAEIQGILVSSRDITDQLAYERKLHDAASRDPLTGLANRRVITEEVDSLVARGAPLAVAFLGIDRFKLINDSLGHTVGDTVLEVVARRVVSSAPAGAVVGRFGGDLLVLVLSGAAAADVRSLVWRVIERVGEPLFVAGHELRIAMSGGMAQLDATSTGTSLLRDADLALHRAKILGGARAEEFVPAMREEAIARLELEADLRRAITRSEFALALQPIVSLGTGEHVSAEALVRWHRGDDVVAPCMFIPAAEETGLIVPLGEWIIEQAARLVPQSPGGHIRINLSPRQLSSPDLVQRIARALSLHQLPASSLGFEVTESLLMKHFEFATEVLTKIRRLGCPVGLDDFGCGYSSLGYLRRLPIDFLKIDLSLTADVDTDPQASAIFGAILDMAEALGLETVAEGVETNEQAATLRDLGCSLAQGFLFGRPHEPA